METKKILNYLEKTRYCILVPKYYECEEKPSWVVTFVGTKKECEEKFADYPEFFKASNYDNREMREIRLKEYLFMKTLPQTRERKERISDIKRMYGFN